VHIKNLKSYHRDSTVKKCSSHFQKQGGDAINFDCSENEDNKDDKFERSDMKDWSNQQQPKEQYKDEDNNHTENEVSDSDCTSRQRGLKIWSKNLM
jgi:hypothetical protein